MKLKLVRDQCGVNTTLGKLYVNGVYECETLEDADRRLEDDGEKIYGCTAIPRGTYDLIINWSNRFKKQMPLLLSVPGFAGIRIHPGNVAADTEGCILVGSSRGDSWINRSRPAYERLFSKLEDAFDRGEHVTIEVI